MVTILHSKATMHFYIDVHALHTFAHEETGNVVEVCLVVVEKN
jgi:hypothetical protein